MSNSFTQNLKSVWEIWKRLAHKIGNFQARVLLTLLYALPVLPFGVAVRLFSDPLQIKRRPTAWMEHPADVHNLDWARKQ
ncbi:MAG TPA: hypothetical protein VLX60_12715 [Terriglobales bacterium]|nr:hypothetical protein [Terriglobales bacterium]